MRQPLTVFRHYLELIKEDLFNVSGPEQSLGNFQNELYVINYRRFRLVSVVILLLYLILLALDLNNYLGGKWQESNGYIVIFLSHASAIILLIIIKLVTRISSPDKPEEVRRFHRIFFTFISLHFMLVVTVISYGDLQISSTIGAYLGGAFSIGVCFILTNNSALLVYITSSITIYAVLAISSKQLGRSFSVQIINAFIYSFIAYVLSRILYYFQRQIFFDREQITRQKSELEKLAMTDHLTGILNRRAFLMRADEEIARAERYKTPFCLAILDLDHFKAINDKYGHDEGDTVLVHISILVQQHIRRTDIFARWGGEEFVMILIGSDVEDMLLNLEKIRKLLKKETTERGIPVTASFGVTQFREKDTCDTLLNRADKALYQSKESGRNRITVI